MTEESVHRGVTLETVRQTMKLVTAIPKPWSVLVLTAALASILDFAVSPSGWTIGVHVGTVTVAVLGLLWLPVLINVIALAGGGMKTPAGEASSHGLLDILFALTPDAKREALPSVIAALGSVQAGRPEAQAIRTELEEELSTIPMDPSDARSRLHLLARRYEEMRRALDPGPRRTFDLDRLVAEAVGLAREAHHQPAPTDAFSQEDEGDRIIDVASIQALRSPSYLPQVLDAIQASRSAFEQYHGLVALEKLVPLLNRHQKVEALEMLQTMRSGGGVRQITRDDPSRWILSGQLLARLTQRDSA